MNKQFVQVLLDLSQTIDRPTEYKEGLLKVIKHHAANATFNPRDRTESNVELLGHTFDFVLDTVEALYGEFELDIRPLPILDIPRERSVVVSFSDNGKRKWTAAINSNVSNWEDFLYDLCHESIHLLNPVERGTRISALEEGVAVKFAEDMFFKYVSHYRPWPPQNSPTNDQRSQYFKVFLAARKIPNNTLREIRGLFGTFSAVGDCSQLRSMLSPFVDDDETRLLLTEFQY